MFRKISLLLCACLTCVACSKKQTLTIEENPTDYVAVVLGEAAEQAHSELAILAKVRGKGIEPLLPPSNPSLNQDISIAWTGSANGAIKEICLQIGYRYEETGTPSAQTLSVVVHGLDSPAYKLLEDIAWQIQPQALLKIDPINRTITLARTMEVVQ